MNRKFTDETELAGAIGGLPDSIEPQHDLWPGIASRLSVRQGRTGSARTTPVWRRHALAASLAVAFATGILFGRQMGQEEIPQADLPAGDLAMVAALQASEREYHAAFRQFIPVGEARPMLETQAVQNIENSWFELQQAESALLAALHEYPENTYLNEKLLDLRAQQLGFMQQLAMLDQFSRRKT